MRGKWQSFPDRDSQGEEVECDQSWLLTNSVSTGVTVFVKDEWRSVNLRACCLSGTAGFLEVVTPPAWIRIIGPSSRNCV